MRYLTLGRRSLGVALCGLLLAVVASVPNLLAAKPVLATSSCGGAEVEDTVYEGPSRTATVWVTDSYRPGPDGHFVDVGLRTWYLSHTGNCWRTYEGLVRVEDGTPASIATQFRARVCDTGPWSFQDNRGPQWTSAEYITPQSAWGSASLWWIIPNSDVGAVWVVWAPYGNPPCNAQAESYQSIAQTDTWTPSPLVSNPGTAWYVSGW